MTLITHEFEYLYILSFHITEGQLISCSYDYLSEDWNSVSFVLYAYIFNYCIPVSSCIFFYSQIVLAVVKHEAALREQAKKMNVESLRQGDHVCTFPRVILAMRINLLENYPLFTG